MTQSKVIEVAYKTISEALEWGYDCEDKSYAQFVDGVVNMTDALLEEMDKMVEEDIECDGECENCEKFHDDEDWMEDI